jgi:thymidylate synthase (FAD)
MVNVVMEIVTTRDIARQILRHKSCAFQEFSQRYADPTQFDFELREARLQDPKNRQNSLYPDVGSEATLNATWKHYQLKVQKAAKEAYDWAIANGIAKEQARAVLPEGMTVTKLYVNGSLRSWIHFIQVRNCPGPQKELTRVAQAATDEVGRLFPAMKNMLEEMVDETWGCTSLADKLTNT